VVLSCRRLPGLYRDRPAPAVTDAAGRR